MSRTARRVELTPGYLLHRRSFRDTSLIIEFFTREHGRLTCFARGARGPKRASSACSRSSRCCSPGSGAARHRS